jgi:hypothetical protein
VRARTAGRGIASNSRHQTQSQPWHLGSHFESRFRKGQVTWQRNAPVNAGSSSIKNPLPNLKPQTEGSGSKQRGKRGRYS